MQTTKRLGTFQAATLLRWGARILSGVILLFWGLMLIAHLFGEEGRPSRPLAWQDFAILTSLMASLLGLAVAWKWELAGGALTLAAVSICACFNWQVLFFPGTLIPIAAVMFLTSRWLSLARRNEPVATSQ